MPKYQPELKKGLIKGYIAWDTAKVFDSNNTEHSTANQYNK